MRSPRDGTLVDLGGTTLVNIKPYEVRNQARASVLLDSAKSYLPPGVPVMRSMIDNNEPELALDDMLEWLEARAEPLPKSLVSEHGSRRSSLI
jgi:hypothetical protein